MPHGHHINCVGLKGTLNLEINNKGAFTRVSYPADFQQLAAFSQISSICCGKIHTESAHKLTCSADVKSIECQFMLHVHGGFIAEFSH